MKYSDRSGKEMYVQVKTIDGAMLFCSVKTSNIASRIRLPRMKQTSPSIGSNQTGQSLSISSFSTIVAVNLP